MLYIISGEDLIERNFTTQSPNVFVRFVAKYIHFILTVLVMVCEDLCDHFEIDRIAEQSF